MRDMGVEVCYYSYYRHATLQVTRQPAVSAVEASIGPTFHSGGDVRYLNLLNGSRVSHAFLASARLTAQILPSSCLGSGEQAMYIQYQVVFVSARSITKCGRYIHLPE